MIHRFLFFQSVLEATWGLDYFIYYYPLSSYDHALYILGIQ